MKKMENQSLIFQNSANDYLSFGWSLLPMQFVVDADGRTAKRPMVKWKNFQTTRPTKNDVDLWLKNGWFLGIITGHLSGIVIVDDDRIKHGLNPTTLDSTIIAKTKSGGKHYYYRYDRPIGNHANANLFVDIRGEGGYCVLPPFNAYEWVKPPTEEALKNLPVLSKKVEEEIVGIRKIGGEKIVLSDYEVIKEGERNSTLHKLACSIWNNDKLTDSERVSQIKWLNETRCITSEGKPNPVSDQELETIINQAKMFVEKNPKTTPTGGVKKEIPKPLDMSYVISERLKEKEIEKDCPSTGFPTLDKMVKGFVPKHTYVLTGDTNVGKTSLACYFACAVASQMKKVLYLALEPDTGVVEYMASIINNKRFDELDPKTDYDFADLPIKIYTKTQIDTVDTLLAALDVEREYDLVIIDHIGYFVTDKSNTNQEQSNVIKKLARIATEKKMAVMMIAHMRKPERGNKKRMPTMDDISGSGAFKQDGTDVWIVYKELDPDDTTKSKYLNTGNLIVSKSKSGKTGPIPLTFGEMKAGIYEATLLAPSVDDNFR